VDHAGGDLEAHALAEGELSDGDVEEALEVEEVGQLIFRSLVLVWGDAVDVAEELEAFDDGEVPPELGALAEDGADAGDVPDSGAPGDEAADFAVAARRFENSAEDLEGSRLAAPLGPMRPRSSPSASWKLIPFRASIVRERRRTRPVSAPTTPGWRSATRKDFVRRSTTMWGEDMLPGRSSVREP
jgi:hypothetical protein